MTFQLPIKTFVKNNQTRRLSKTWHDRIVQREIIKNNYRVTGNLQNAKVFAHTVTTLPFAAATITQPKTQPILIYSKNYLEEVRQHSTLQVV